MPARNLRAKNVDTPPHAVLSAKMTGNNSSSMTIVPFVAKSLISTKRDGPDVSPKRNRAEGCPTPYCFKIAKVQTIFNKIASTIKKFAG